jgi:hypothetical protein
MHINLYLYFTDADKNKIIHTVSSVSDIRLSNSEIYQRKEIKIVVFLRA